MCSYLIRKLVFRLREGELFTTRDCLTMGTRGAIDMCLSRMVKDGIIIRLVRGMFVRREQTNREYSDEELAKVKADSFGKQLLEHGVDAGKRLGLEPEPNEGPTFYTNGSTSYFRVCKTRVKVKMHRIAPRKGICPGDNIVGHTIRALWHLGKNVVDAKDIQIATNRFGRTHNIWFGECWRYMPAWLTARCA